MGQKVQTGGLSRAAAETLVLRALGWAASDEAEETGIFNGFLAQSGLSRDDLPARAAEGEFLAAFLDFILTEESWVLACADALAIPPESLLSARLSLPGGEVVHWT